VSGPIGILAHVLRALRWSLGDERGIRTALLTAQHGELNQRLSCTLLWRKDRVLLEAFDYWAGLRVDDVVTVQTEEQKGLCG
jgi:hypothetical protein